MKRFFLLLFVFFINLRAVEIDIKVISDTQIKDDQTGNTIPAVYKGESFTIKVEIKDVSGSISEPRIKDNNDLNLTMCSNKSSRSLINGYLRQTYTYEYVGVFNEPGLFLIGPAYVEEDGKLIESRQVLLKVLDEDNAAKAKVINDKKYDLFCKLEANKINVVEGEPVELNIRIYKRGEILKIGMAMPDFKDFQIIESQELINGQEKIDGKIYDVIEKKYILISEQTGIQKIEPIQIEFAVPKKKNRKKSFGFWGGYNPFIGFNRTKVKRAFSNPLEIKVNSLPDKKNIDGIGDFSAFTIKVDKKEAIVNEPILLKAEITGFSNLEQIVPPKLNLPEHITYYESKSHIKKNKKNSLQGKKVFEYILQINKPGPIKINPQKFVFYDTKENKYKEINSNPIVLNINKPPLEEEGINGNGKFMPEQENTVGFYGKDINFIEENISFLNRENKKSLPLGWLIFLLILSGFILFSDFFKNFFSKILSYFFKKSRIEDFEERLSLIIDEQKIESLYKFFISFFAYYFNLEQNNLDEDIIEKKLFSLGWNRKKIDEFLSYLHLCASVSFSASSDFLDRDKLLNKSRYWFLLLKN